MTEIFYALWALAVGAILYFQFKKEKRKSDDYFGIKRQLTRREKAQLEFYRNIYTPISPDKRLPSTKKDGWELVDIALSATEIIYDNPIPSIEEINSLRPGDLIKLKFVDNDGEVERMWVEYKKMDDGLIQGVLRNDSFDIDNLRDRNEIWFHPNHIFSIEKIPEVNHT